MHMTVDRISSLSVKGWLDYADLRLIHHLWEWEKEFNIFYIKLKAIFSSILCHDVRLD